MHDPRKRRFRRSSARWIEAMVLGLSVGGFVLPAAGQTVFPGATWTFKTPSEVGMDAAKLDQIAGLIGGNGCIVRDGYMVKTWGSQSAKADWASAAKPMISTMLFFAIEEGLVSDVDYEIRNLGWPLSTKDQTITFAHLANMISGYTRGESPGAAWAYNDYAIQLYAKSLFAGGTGSRTPVYNQVANTVATDPSRLGALQFQDGSIFSSRGGNGISTSVRDYARIGWWWLNNGNWDGTQILPSSYFDLYMQPHVPAELPRTTTVDPAGDYLGIGTYGGGSDQTNEGPAIYGFNWWFNPGQANWPDAPEDAFQCNGHWGREVVTMIPSLRIVMAFFGGATLPPRSGTPNMNQVLTLLAESAPPDTPLIGLNTSIITRVVDLTENLPDDSFAVSNTGIGTLQYRITDDKEWLEVDPTTGSSTGEPDTITVSYSVAGLAVGTYVAAIEVSDNGSSPPAFNSPQTITVTVEVKTVLPDFDADGDVDQEDFGVLQACFTPLGDAIPLECADTDMNKDDIVDQDDLTIFQACASGANIPAEKTCDDAFD